MSKRSWPILYNNLLYKSRLNYQCIGSIGIAPNGIEPTGLNPNGIEPAQDWTRGIAPNTGLNLHGIKNKKKRGLKSVVVGGFGIFHACARTGYRLTKRTMNDVYVNLVLLYGDDSDDY